MKRLFVVSTLALLGLVNTWASGPLVPLSDQLTIFSPTLTVIGQVSVFEDGSFSGLHAACNGPTCGTTEDSANIYYIDLPGVAFFTTPTMLVESPTVGSDVFGTINLGIGYLTLFFNSDSEAVEFNPSVGGYLLVPESNGTADASAYLISDLRASGYTAQFFSDAEVAPEPATMVLLGCGLVALGWRRRRAR